MGIDTLNEQIEQAWFQLARSSHPPLLTWSFWHRVWLWAQGLRPRITILNAHPVLGRTGNGQIGTTGTEHNLLDHNLEIIVGRLPVTTFLTANLFSIFKGYPVLLDEGITPTELKLPCKAVKKKKKIPSILSLILGLTSWLNRLILSLQCRHPIWALVLVLDYPLPVQLLLAWEGGGGWPKAL